MGGIERAFAEIALRLLQVLLGECEIIAALLGQEKFSHGTTVDIVWHED